MIDFDAMRQNMITNQILSNKVTGSGLIQALHTVKREQFVPGTYHSVAYSECDLEIVAGRYLAQPMVVSRMIEAADPKPFESVLVVGSGTGYTCALLNFLCAKVIGLEENDQLFDYAEHIMSTTVFSHIQLIKGNLVNGWADGAPYDIILIEGGIDQLPDFAATQLAPENGRIIYFKNMGAGIPAQAIKCTIHNQRFNQQDLFEAHVPQLSAFKQQKGFSF